MPISALRVARNNSFINQRPWLANIVGPLSERYKQLSGYRLKGLLADDLISEENDVVQKALKRLPPKVAYDRVFRLRRAMQLSLTHAVLPPSERTKPEEDIPYLRPYIEEIEAQIEERSTLDNLVKK